jgi:hypothetical protein
MKYGNRSTANKRLAIMNTRQFSLSLWMLVSSVWVGTAMEQGSTAHSAPRNNVNFGIDEQKSHRFLDNIMFPGPRVAGMDRTAAICSASYSYDLSVAMEETIVEYYYAIESSENITVKDTKGSMLVRNLEKTLFLAIHSSILWCYYENGTVGKRNLKPSGDIHARRRMSLEEARLLSIVTFSTTPEDEGTSSTFVVV